MNEEVIAFGISIAVVVFFLAREVVTWYWKINRRIELLERIDNNLEYIARLIKTQSPPNIDTLIDTKMKAEEDEVEGGLNKI